MKMTNFLMMITLLGFVSCGGNGSGSSVGGSRTTVPSAHEFTHASPGTYYAILRPVNIQSNGFIPYGQATFTLKDDQLQASTVLDDDQAVSHRQTLHMGSRCPNNDDDTNGDGLIDYNEAMTVVGKAVMPLDNDINSQSAGAEIYPKGPSMTWTRMASIGSVNTDLWKAGEDPSANVTKLPRGRGIGFDGRVVLIHGTTPQRSFPSSLAARSGEYANISLPIVCGVLKKIE